MKVLAITAATVLMATQALAGSYETRCQTRNVPYQDTVKGGSPEQVIGGAIVGGVIGKVVTKKDAGGAIGAVIGGAVANENSTKTVTRYKPVETCTKVFVPERIGDEQRLVEILTDLNAGRSVAKELIMDAQFTIGVAHDGQWGPKSRQAAQTYLASIAAEAPADGPVYSVVVNEVVIISSSDIDAAEDVRKALFEAGVDARIVVDVQ